MGKNKKEKPELTLENLNRAIRTYQQLASLQNMEILQSVAKQENFLDPEIFCNQSDSSVIKNVWGFVLCKILRRFSLYKIFLNHAIPQHIMIP